MVVHQIEGRLREVHLWTFVGLSGFNACRNSHTEPLMDNVRQYVVSRHDAYDHELGNCRRPGRCEVHATLRSHLRCWCHGTLKLLAPLAA